MAVEWLSLNLSLGVWIGVQGTLGDALSHCILIFFLLDWIHNLSLSWHLYM